MNDVSQTSIERAIQAQHQYANLGSGTDGTGSAASWKTILLSANDSALDDTHAHGIPSEFWAGRAMRARHRYRVFRDLLYMTERASR